VFRHKYYPEDFICRRCCALHTRVRNARGAPKTYCMPCERIVQNASRKAYSELTPEQRFKSNARAYANTYQRRGLLEAQPCQECGASKAEKHHEDYSKPLDVIWLCKACHCRLHSSTWNSTNSVLIVHTT